MFRNRLLALLLAVCCIAGLSCAGGRPDRVLYGIPARYTPEPPPGLEGYAWRGDTGGGYWVIVRPVC